MMAKPRPDLQQLIGIQIEAAFLSNNGCQLTLVGTDGTQYMLEASGSITKMSSIANSTKYQLPDLNDDLAAMVETEHIKVSRREITVRVVNAVVEVIGIQDQPIDLNYNLIEHYGADSLDLVEFIMAVEDEFNVEIDDPTAEQMCGSTIQQMIDALYQRLND